MKDQTYGNELKNKLLHDFTILSNLVNSSSNAQLKQVSEKCQELSPSEFMTYFHKLNMIKVRNSRTKSQTIKCKRRTRIEIRDLIVAELKKQPTSSLYQLRQATNIDFHTLRRFIDRYRGMFEVEKMQGATYVKLKPHYQFTNYNG